MESLVIYKAKMIPFVFILLSGLLHSYWTVDGLLHSYCTTVDGVYNHNNVHVDVPVWKWDAFLL